MRIKPTYQKTFSFCQKNLTFVGKKRERVNEHLKSRKNMVNTAFEPATSGFRAAVTLDTGIIQNTNSADLNSARHEQFQEKGQNVDN